jgi:uncharacterized membrane protein YeaQ/YmgE (transglycosylase-associated protein family)
MDIVSIVLQIISGVIGGNLAGMSKHSMGSMLNSIVGGVGGIIVGQLLATITGDTSTVPGSSMDLSSLISSIVGGGAGGAVLTYVVGLIKSRLDAR